MTATNVLAGILIALAVTFVGVGAFFVRAWSQRREGEYLLFGLLSVGLSVYTGGLAPIYALEGATWAATWPRTIDVATLGALVSIALAVHFALRFGKVAVERPVMMASYAVVLFFGGVVLAGKWWERIPEAAVPVDLLGVRIYSTPCGLRRRSRSATRSSRWASWRCARSWPARSSTETRARAAFLGSGILCATVFNNASVASAKRVGVFLALRLRHLRVRRRAHLALPLRATLSRAGAAGRGSAQAHARAAALVPRAAEGPARARPQGAARRRR